MIITLSTPLALDGQLFPTIKVGIFELESDRMADAHILRPMAARVLPLWRGAAYDEHADWTSVDVVERVNELHAAGELQKCFVS